MCHRIGSARANARHNLPMDEDDKVRRNLVVASAAVLLCAWLKVSIPALANRLMSGPTSAPSITLDPVRLWAGALVVLVYLLLRFRFCKATGEAWTDYKKEWSKVRERIATATLRAHLRRASQKRIESPLFDTSLVNLLAQKTRATQEDLGNLQVDRLRTPVVEAPGITMMDGYSGKANLAFLWTDEGAVQHASAGYVEDFAFRKYERWKLIVRTALELATYSRASVQVFVPVLLAVLAFGVSAWNLAIALYR
jgi:ABC-type multidrug transport system fused ATPase/permease subunit